MGPERKQLYANCYYGPVTS